MHQTFVRYPFIGLGGGRKSFELLCIIAFGKRRQNCWRFPSNIMGKKGTFLDCRRMAKVAEDWRKIIHFWT